MPPVRDEITWDPMFVGQVSKKATDLMEISSADTFPHYIPIGPNTGEVFIAKI